MGGVCCATSLPDCTPSAPKGGAHLPGKLLVIVMARDLHEFPPPSQHLHMSGTPQYPVWLAQRRGLQIFGIDVNRGGSQGWAFPTQEFLEVGLQWWGILQIVISFNQDGPILFPWPQPVDLFVGHLLSLPHWWANQWALSTPVSCSRLSSVSKGALPLAKVTQNFCLVGLGDLIHPQMVSLWCGVA